LVKVETLWRHSAAIKRKKRVSVRHLNANAQAQTNFATAFCEDLQNSDTLAYDMSLQVMWDKTVQAMRQAERTLPDPRREPNKPWISAMTLELIEQRMVARSQNNRAE
jgi:hypothetical protein